MIQNQVKKKEFTDDTVGQTYKKCSYLLSFCCDNKKNTTMN